MASSRRALPMRLPLASKTGIRAAALFAQLHAHPFDRQHPFACRAGRITSCDGSARDLLLALRLEDFRLDIARLTFGPSHFIFKGSKSARLLAEPERAHQRNLGAAVRRFASDGPRPQARDGNGSIRIGRIILREFLFGLFLYLRADHPGSWDRRGRVAAARTASRGIPRAAVAPTTDEVCSDARAERTSRAPNARSPPQSENPPPPAAYIPWGSPRRSNSRSYPIRKLLAQFGGLLPDNVVVLAGVKMDVVEIVRPTAPDNG